MALSDLYLHFVLASPYAVIAFALIWIAMRAGSGWTLNVSGAKLTMSVVIAALGSAGLVTLLNGAIYINSPSTYLEDAVLPLDAAGAIIYTAISIGVSFAVATWMQSSYKQASTASA